jgi:hypothetical protein
MHCEPQASSRRGIVYPLRNEIESLAHGKRLPLRLRETNPIRLLFFLNRGMEVAELLHQQLHIAFGTEEGPQRTLLFRNSRRARIPKIRDQQIALDVVHFHR